MYKFQKRIMVKTHKVEGFDAFKAKVEELAGTGADVFVMFSGSKNAEGVSWCPDCVEAKPAIQKLVDAGSRPIVKGIVTRDEWRGNASHPYKVSPVLKAAGVPSVILFEGENELHRVDDLGDFANEDLMGLFLED